MLFSQNKSFEEGVALYNKRSENIMETVVDGKNILQAINIFESFLDTDKDLEVAVYLVRSYYFMAQYVSQDRSDKILYFDLAKTLSDQYVEKYPDSVEILYWNLANTSNWAKTVGLKMVSKLGEADRYRAKAVDVIVLDPEYEDGGGYFLLGAVYYTAPRIPLLLTWPNNDKAIKYFTKAVQTGKATPLQLVYLSKALLDGGYMDTAKKTLLRLIDVEPRIDNYLEDLYYINEAKSLYNKNFNL
tara:strand:- start:276 stop:1007 length:732 start_codon:yes stop_codon:yes gene_type:complete